MHKTYSSINEILLHAFNTYPDKLAVRWRTGKETEEQRTYSDLYKDVAKVCGYLSTICEEGSHVALIGPTSYNWLCIYLGIVCSNRVAVPLDVLLPGTDIATLVNRADVCAFFADRAKSDYLEIAKENCPECKHFINMDNLFDSEHAGECESIPVTALEDPDILTTIMFTSGTTGISKGVMLTHRNLAENATCLDMGIKENPVVLTVLPVHHAYCLSMDILKGISLGACICINESLLKIAQNILYFEPEIILMVPMMVETFGKKINQIIEKSMLLKLTGPKVMKKKAFGSRLHTVYCGGAYLNPDYIELFKKMGVDLIQGYGMTENAPVIANGYGKHVKRESVGKPIPNCEVKIVDGEIAVRGSSVMMGYYKMPEETAETLKDGWLYTGDLGHLDEDGFLYLTGRKKNLIITKNGENVSPEELENILGTSLLIGDVMCRENEGIIEAVIYPDLEAFKTKKIPEDNVRETLQALIDDYNKKAPAYKQIHKLTVRDTEFEKTSTKKIKRY